MNVISEHYYLLNPVKMYKTLKENSFVVFKTKINLKKLLIKTYSALKLFQLIFILICK